ncbi:hypothetical protein BHE74_00046364 [Ensete ventricosum]|nr:hypothetical protein BHE74_00046364 [Ensete ventricosum]
MRFPNNGIRAKSKRNEEDHGQPATGGTRKGRPPTPARKGLLARVQAARVSCPQRGHRGSARPQPARDEATRVAPARNQPAEGRRPPPAQGQRRWQRREGR